MSRWTLWLVLIAITLGMVELTARAGLWAMRSIGRVPAAAARVPTLTTEQEEILAAWLAGESAYFMHSAELGWTIRPHGEVGPYRANGQGLRAEHEYELRPPAGRIRVATFGDSFTHGAEVGYDETWQRRLEALAPSLEVLNFGVNAYGLDQSLLRYLHDGQRLQAEIVLIGIMSENINRQVSVYRPFYQPETGMPFAKPRFVLDAGEIRLRPNPLAQLEDYQRLMTRSEETLLELGVHDHYYQVRSRAATGGLAAFRLLAEVSRRFAGRNRLSPGFERGAYDPDSEAYRVTEKVLDRFCDDVSANGALPVVLLFPNRADVVRASSQKPRSYQPLIDHLQRREIAWIDLQQALDRAGEAQLFTAGGHYLPRGHLEVAETVLQQLQALDLVDETGR